MSEDAIPKPQLASSRRKQAFKMVQEIKGKRAEIAEIDAILASFGFNVMAFLGLTPEPVRDEVDIYALDNKSLSSEDLRFKRAQLYAEARELQQKLRSLQAMLRQERLDADHDLEAQRMAAYHEQRAAAQTDYRKNPDEFFKSVLFNADLALIDDDKLFTNAEKIILAMEGFKSELDPNLKQHLWRSWQLVMAALYRANDKHQTYIKSTSSLDANIEDALLERSEKMQVGAEQLLDKLLQLVPAEFAPLKVLFEHGEYEKLAYLLRGYFDDAKNNQDLLLQLAAEIAAINEPTSVKPTIVVSRNIEDLIKPTVGMTVNVLIVLGSMSLAGILPPMWPLFAGTAIGAGMGVWFENLRSQRPDDKKLQSILDGVTAAIYLPTELLGYIFVTPFAQLIKRFDEEKLTVMTNKEQYKLPGKLLAKLNSIVENFGSNLVTLFQNRAQELIDALHALDEKEPHFQSDRARLNLALTNLESDWREMVNALQVEDAQAFCSRLKEYLRQQIETEKRTKVVAGPSGLYFTSKMAPQPYVQNDVAHVLDQQLAAVREKMDDGTTLHTSLI